VAFDAGCSSRLHGNFHPQCVGWNIVDELEQKVFGNGTVTNSSLRYHIQGEACLPADKAVPGNFRYKSTGRGLGFTIPSIPTSQFLPAGKSFPVSGKVCDVQQRFVSE
jgi:hypothetical protein